jgi:hypothetical protein
VPPFVALLANTLVALSLFAVAGGGGRLIRGLTRRTAAVAVLPLLSACFLIAYVSGEDSYRENGISRWDAYRSPGGALGPMFVVSVAVMAICAALLAYSGLRSRNRPFRTIAFAAGLSALLLVTPTIIGFSTN